jgi:hypothetical protein
MANQEKNFTAWIRKEDIQSSILKCERIFNSGIISSDGAADPLFEPAVVTLLINLNDLLGKSNKDGNRITISDQVQPNEKIKDVTDLIRECRNAACHIGSGEHVLEGFNKFTFNVIAGLAPSAFEINGIDFGCDFANDIAVYYGDKRVYMRRHLLAALEAVTANYPPN